jgi:hypothetical protein
MTPSETVILTRYVAACCPQQAIDDYTPDAWHDLLSDLSAADCRAAVAAVAKRQPFVAPAEIRAEVKRIRRDRLERIVTPALPAELTDEPGRYQAALQADVKRIADGFSIRKAIGRLPSETLPALAEVRKAIGPVVVAPAERLLAPEEIAGRQAAESRAARGASVITEPDEGEPTA